LHIRLRLDLATQRCKVECRSVGAKQILGQLKAANGGDPLRAHAALDSTTGDDTGRDHDCGGAQYMIIECLELRVPPEASGVASGHAHDMRHARDIGDEMARYSIRFEIV
jgi:hypothetical protein